MTTCFIPSLFFVNLQPFFHMQGSCFPAEWCLAFQMSTPVPAACLRGGASTASADEPGSKPNSLWHVPSQHTFKCSVRGFKHLIITAQAAFEQRKQSGKLRLTLASTQTASLLLVSGLCIHRNTDTFMYKTDFTHKVSTQESHFSFDRKSWATEQFTSVSAE